MRTLMLMRHAKSDWDDPKLADESRRLSKRGEKDAPRMGAHMRAENWEPELVLCSAATRTRETWALLEPELKTTPKVEFDKALYLAAWPTLLALVQRQPAGVKSLLLVGHNPGIEQVAVALALQPKTPSERARVESISRKFPTCALAVLEFEGAWKDVKAGTGRLAAFVKPKDLGQA